MHKSKTKTKLTKKAVKAMSDQNGKHNGKHEEAKPEPVKPEKIKPQHIPAVSEGNIKAGIVIS